MAILDGDIKIMKSAVMDDVPEGGGAATGVEVVDGVSNNMFPDISEIDRTVGRLQLRKIFPAVRTLNTDTYLGANVIVLDPPDDPLVSAVLFNTESDFDTRTEAVSRIESYLAQGTLYSGYLFGNHITGQRTLSMLIREELPTPAIGTVLLLRKNEGLSSQTDQYVRITELSSIVRTFTDGSGDFRRREMTIGISDPLRFDFPGFLSAIRNDATVDYAGRTKAYNTIVADAAQYFGIVPLAEAASVGDFSLKADGIYASVVPSAQIETPIADSRLNQQSAGLVAAGDSLTISLTLAWTTTQSLFVGGGILPGSLSVVRSSVTITDQGGKLMNGGTEVGTVDYSNGILSLATNVFGTGGGTHAVSYIPASEPTAVTQSVGVPVTISSRSLTYVVTLNVLPARKSLQVSYSSGGNWYVLSEDGTGAIKGVLDGTGAGTLNYSTGTVSLTLGALPDVGTAIIYQWVEQVQSPKMAPSTLLLGGKLYLPITAGGVISEDPDTPVASLDPTGITITWNDGAAKTSTDNGSGLLTGDATGTVDYAKGVIRFSPNSIPNTGTNIHVELGKLATANEATTSTSAGATWTLTLSNAPKPRTVRLICTGSVPTTPTYDNNIAGYADSAATIYDDGAGKLFFQLSVFNYAQSMDPIEIGTIDYVTRACVINKTAAASITLNNMKSVFSGSSLICYAQGGQTTKSFTLNVNGPTSAIYSYTSPSVETYDIPLTELHLKASIGANYVLGGVAFDTISGSTRRRHQGIVSTGKVVRDVSPTTGLGTDAGTYLSATGVVKLTDWLAGTNPQVQNWAGTQAPPVEGVNSPFVSNTVLFRSAISPLRPGSFSVQGTMDDGVTFNVTADTSGVINSTRVKGKVNYEAGVIQLFFTQASPSGLGTQDLSDLGISGVGVVNVGLVKTDTLRYNAVAFTYIPLDADIIGVDPVRLPSDGRVPIFRPGSVLVLHHTKAETPTVVSNGDTINVGRTRLAKLRVRGNDGNYITSGYTVDLDAGTVHFTSVAGYSQPVTIIHRIEDTLLASEVQITGDMSVTRQITHDFPVPGSYVSSAMLVGDRHARVSSLFDQQNWGNVWSDDLIGSAASATFDKINYPPVINNLGAVTERWALVFTNTTTFNIIGEHLGQIGSGNITTDVEPLNPASGQPYFHLDFEGFGSGWAAGNVIRLNTVGALFPVWVGRVIRQGPATEANDSFEILVRGDVDA